MAGVAIAAMAQIARKNSRILIATSDERRTTGEQPRSVCFILARAKELNATRRGGSRRISPSYLSCLACHALWRVSAAWVVLVTGTAPATTPGAASPDKSGGTMGAEAAACRLLHDRCSILNLGMKTGGAWSLVLSVGRNGRHSQHGRRCRQCDNEFSHNLPPFLQGQALVCRTPKVKSQQAARAILMLTRRGGSR